MLAIIFKLLACGVLMFVGFGLFVLTVAMTKDMAPGLHRRFFWWTE